MKKLTALFFLLAALLSGCGYTATTPTTVPPAAAISGEETLTVHFIDVGQADCILLECGGEFALIDGGNKDDSQLVVAYLEDQGVEILNTVISTHPHEDHLGGLPAVLSVFPTQTILSPTTTHDSKIFNDFLHYADQQGVPVEIPEPGSVYHLGNEDGGATLTILGPVQAYPNLNDTSLVVQAEFGGTRFLFTGDMEVTAENDMLDYWEGQVDWQSDVLKVGHHGSYTSTGYRFLYEVNPSYAVISLGGDNPYGYPHDEPMSRLKHAGVTALRTDTLGTIVATSDGKDISFTWEKQNAQPEDVVSAEEFTYIGNRNSLKFHTDRCENLPSQRNQVIFQTYNDAIAAGYTPCGGCFG